MIEPWYIAEYHTPPGYRKRVQTKEFNPQRLKKAIQALSGKSLVSGLPDALKGVIWELMKCQTHIRKLELELGKLKNESKTRLQRHRKLSGRQR